MSLDPVRPVELMTCKAAHGELAVLDQVPHKCQRMFTSTLTAGFSAGKHANLVTMMTCVVLTGILEINAVWSADNKLCYKTTKLSPTESLVLFPGVWREFTAIENCTYVVLCSHSYDPNEYVSEVEQLPEIRDFLKEVTAYQLDC